MHATAKSKLLQDSLFGEMVDLSRYVPREFGKVGDPQTAIPRIAKDPHSIELIKRAVQHVPTSHWLYRGDARNMLELKPQSVHLVLTSPPTLFRRPTTTAHIGYRIEAVALPRKARPRLGRKEARRQWQGCVE